jgi:2,4-dienoyl-CoA reductase-like NADH-dependent reductase (Old Yellow Enzyme family)
MDLFSSLQLGSIQMKNRLLRSATGEGAAEIDVGCPTEEMVTLYDRIAAGGIGLIITGHTAVSREGRCSNTMTAFYSDDFIPAFRRMVEASHAHGTPIVGQLNHGGRQVNPEHKDIRALCPSAVQVEGADCVPEELSPADIERLIADYGKAAGRCKRAGFDGVQIHSAHGYLVSQFNSSLTNQRTDEWGGSPEKRRRFLAAVYESMRAHVGDDYPILIKQNVADFHPDGLTTDEAVEICRMVDGLGIAAIELSGGIRETISIAFREEELREKGEVVFFEEEAKRIKPEINCPLIVTGGIRTAATAQRLVAEGTCDGVGLCRAMLEEPDLPAKWERRHALGDPPDDH